jgi:hypothetical protein
MAAIKAYFSDTMVEALKEQNVNIVNIEDATGNHKVVTIVVSDGSELFNIFSAGSSWREKMMVVVGS